MTNKIIFFLFVSFLSIKIDAQQPASTDTITFKACFYSGFEKLNLKQDKFKNVPEISFFEGSVSINDTLKKVFQYTSGHFTKADDALARKKILSENGFVDAYIVAFKNGKRIALSEVLK